MKLLKYVFITVILTSVVCSQQSIDAKSVVMQVGEELEYSVHYLGINIGTIVFKVTSKEEKNGKVIYKAQTIIDSNPSLSWLKELHVRFYGEIDQNVYTHGWISIDSTKNKVEYRKMKFDYDNMKMYYEAGVRNSALEFVASAYDTVSINKKCQDGLSLFYYARQNALLRKNEKVPTFIDTNEVNTNIYFRVERTEEEIEAVDDPIDVVRLKGVADFVGVFGLTGAFEGLFTNDSARIPITAKLKVILGSITVELQKWKRGNWAPPKSNN